ncbi:MAG: hypothetical protein ABSA97_14195 [Verrucomicrobiia bacterium]
MKQQKCAHVFETKSLPGGPVYIACRYCGKPLPQDPNGIGASFVALVLILDLAFLAWIGAALLRCWEGR